MLVYNDMGHNSHILCPWKTVFKLGFFLSQCLVEFIH